MSVSVKVIDGTYGRPAAGVPVQLDRDIEGSWVRQHWEVTDEKGDLSLLPSTQFARGIYRLEFGLDSYFSSMGITAFYPMVTVSFRIADPAQSLFLSLVITPSGYYTYRHQ